MKRFAILLPLFLIFLSASWSIFDARFFMMHDFTHVARIVEMYSSLSEGQFPVRWSANFGYGYGMPLFQFYAPLPYLFGALIYGVSGSGVIATKLLILVTTAATIWGSYLLGKELFGKKQTWPSIVLAAGFTLAPYRAVNIFVRGALSEAWGMMAFPFILLGIHRSITKKDISGKVILYLSLVVLFLSHNLTTVLFMPVSILFVLVVAAQSSYKKQNFQSMLRTILEVGVIYFLAVCTAGFYLFPAILEKEYTRVSDAILGGYFNFRLHFLYIRQFFQENWQYGGSSWGPDDDISFYFGAPQIVGAVVSGFWFLLQLYKNRSKLKLFIQKSGWMYIFFALTTVFAALLTTLKAQFIWESIPFLEFVQFPWRWLSVVAFSLSLLSAWFIHSVSITKPKTSVFLAALFISTTLIPAASTYFQPKAYLDDISGVYYEDPASIRQKMSGILPDFIPIQVAESVFLEPLEPGMLFTCERKQPGVEVCSFTHELLIDRAHEKLVTIKSNREQQVEVGIAYYPGWEATDGTANLALHPSSRGLTLIDIPKGEYNLTIRLSKTPIRFWSDLTSAAAVVVVLFIYIKATLKKHD